MSQTLLRYALTTDPFPLQASPDKGNANTATLTVVGSNPNPSTPVTLQGLAVTLPIGANADDLTPTAPTAPVAPDGWTLVATKPSAGQVEYVFLPQAGQGSVGAVGLVFVFNGVSVNDQPGTAEITVKEGSAGNPSQNLYATKFPNGWGSVSFWVDPPDVPYQGSTTLNWSGPSGATYTVEYALGGEVVNVPAPGEQPLGPQGQYPAQTDPPLTLEQTTVFTLNVNEIISGQSYQAQEQKTVTIEVPAPQITSFDAALTGYDFNANPPTATVTLSWTAENTNRLLIDSVGAFKDAQALRGSYPVQITYEPSITYTASAEGLPGYAGAAAVAQTPTLTLPSLAVESYTAASDSATVSGQPALVLTWLVEQAASLDVAETDVSSARDYLGPMFGRTSITTAQPLYDYTLTANGFQTHTETPTPTGASVHTGLSLIPSDWPGFGGFAESAVACRTCRYVAPNIDLYGWDTAFVAPLAEANLALATAQWPMPFTYADTQYGLTASGQFGPWQMVTGGDGYALYMSVPIVSGTISMQYSPPKDIGGATAQILVELPLVPYLTQANPTPGGGASNPFVNVLSIIPPPGSDWSEMDMVILRAVVEPVLNADANAFANLFSIFNPTLNATSCPAWLTTTKGAYIYTEASDPGLGFFVAFAQTTSPNAGPPMLNPQLTQLQQAAFILSEALYRSHS